MTQWEYLSHTYKVRPLGPADVDRILDLYRSNPLYFEHCPPQPDEVGVLSDLTTVPPAKSVTDKAFLGFFQGQDLLAVLDLVKNYPEEAVIFIGLFMVDKSYQGRGIAGCLMTEILEALGKTYKKVRLGFVQTNLQARAFWQKLGFTPTGEVKQTDDYDIVLAEKSLE